MDAKRVILLLFVAALTCRSACAVTPAHAARGAARAYSFGGNSPRGPDGRTGLGPTIGSTTVATPIKSDNLMGKTPAHVAAGALHSLLLTNDGTAFAFGRNEQGLTGQGAASGSTFVATPINTANLAGKSIAQVSAGYLHSLLLADDGSVFSFGWNGYGQTGLNLFDGTALIATPINTDNLADKTPAQVAAGSSHSLLLTDDGSVFSFGHNDDGRTGLGIGSGNTLVATPIDMTNLAGKSITQVAAGAAHNLLLADDGSVFSFGPNAFGATGLGTATGDTLVATPIDMTNLAGKTIAQVAAGGQHSLLLTNDGSVYSFGRNDDGQTGQGTESGNTLVATPIDTSNIAGKSITQVAAGGQHSLLLADDGSVYSFGRNIFGATGLGTTTGDTLIATPIDMTNLGGLRVIGISAGLEHSLLLAVGLQGDFTRDGAVNAADYTVWRNNLGTNFDLNGNGDESAGSAGVVDRADYDLWKLNYGENEFGVGASEFTAQVPEPHLLYLVVAGVIIVSMIRSRRTHCER